MRKVLLIEQLLAVEQVHVLKVFPVAGALVVPGDGTVGNRVGEIQRQMQSESVADDVDVTLAGRNQRDLVPFAVAVGVVRRLNAASGGTQPLSYEVVGLPEGLSFSPDDRTISGVPVNAGRYGVVYLVRDVDGDIDYVSFSWNIRAHEPSPTAPPVAEEEVPEAQPSAPVTAPESAAATEPQQPATSPVPPTYVVAIGGSAERMPACANFQAIIALGHAGVTGNTSAFTQMFSVGDCLWLNEGDEVEVPDPDNTAVAMGRIGDSERAISVAQVSTDDGLKWFPAELLREAR